eukprot:2016745-Pleurochrysis_carterae.AAC.1
MLRAHAFAEASVAVEPDEAALVQLHLRWLRGLRNHVSVELNRAEGKARTPRMAGPAPPSL